MRRRDERAAAHEQLAALEAKNVESTANVEEID